MRIIALSPKVPQIVDIVNRCKTVETLMFEVDNKFTKDTPGVYLPEKKAIIIDPKKCMEFSTMWAGMYTIPATWFTMLWTIHHEIHHTINQRKYEKNPAKSEIAANEYAYDKVHSYKGALPSIRDLGWAGHTLSTILSIQSRVHHKKWAKTQILAHKYNMVANIADLQHVGIKKYTKEIEGHFFLSAKDYFNLNVETKENK